MDRVWAQLYPEFTPSPDVTLPNGGPEALAAYLNAEAAFRRGDYRTARDEYTRVIRADTGFAIGRLRLALVAAQVDPTEQGFGASLRGAVLHQRGLSSADSLLQHRAPERSAKPLLRRVDRKSTRLNSSHTVTSYAGFCLKKKI